MNKKAKTITLAGQALLELSIMGSFLIMLLGVLVNYGMRYYFQQKALQDSFRKAIGMAVSSPHRTGSYVLVRDEHIPDPANPFGVGSVIPVSSQASVTKDWELQETADIESELPHTIIEIQGDTTASDCPSAGSGCTTEGFGSAPRSKIIYGSGFNPVEGEIFSYDEAVRACRIIVDSAACQSECGKQPGKDCSPCNSEVAQSAIPWYCQGYVLVNATAHRYVFPKIDQLFASVSGRRSLGLQTDSKQNTTMNNQLIKDENQGGITTADVFNWTDRTARKIIYKQIGDTSGNVATREVESNAGQTKTQAWTTPW